MAGHRVKVGLSSVPVVVEAPLIKIASRPKRDIPMLGSSRLGEPGGSLAFPVVIGLAGLGGIYASKDAEDGVAKVAVKVLGFAAVGYSLYHVVSGFASSVEANEGVALPSADVSDVVSYGMLSADFVYPAQGQMVGSNEMLGTDYRAKVLFSNQSARAVDVVYQILASERPSYLWGADAGWWSPKEGQVAQGFVSVKAREQVPLAVTLPVLTSLTRLTDYIGITLTLQTRRTASDPWKTASKVDFYYQRNEGA